MSITFLVSAKCGQSQLDVLLDSISKVNGARAIVVDDGSPLPLCNGSDMQVDICDNIPGKHGYGSAMNYLMTLSGVYDYDEENEYVAIAEADDEVDWLAWNALLRKPHTADVVKCSYHSRFDDKDTYHQPSMAKQLGKSRMLDRSELLPLVDHHPAIWSAMYRKSFLNRANIKFVEAHGAGWVDIPFNFDVMLKAKSVEWSREQVYWYTLHNGDNSSTKFDVSLPFDRMIDVLLELHNYEYENGPYESLFDRAFIRAVLKYIDMCFRIYHKADEYEQAKPLIEMLMPYNGLYKTFDATGYEKQILDCYKKNGNVDEWVAGTR